MESFPLREIVLILLAGHNGHRWQVHDDEQWCQVSPQGYRFPIQGWKLHISATWLSSPLVLHHAAQVLVAHRCAFKFARTVARVYRLTQKDTDRAQAGKIITVYPRDDDQLRTIAPLLDQATAGLPGPQILSDQPYREGSLVHFRYGAFTGIPMLSYEGYLESRIEGPDGVPVEDPGVRGLPHHRGSSRPSRQRRSRSRFQPPLRSQSCWAAGTKSIARSGTPPGAGSTTPSTTTLATRS